jgi:hypothetical protein
MFCSILHHPLTASLSSTDVDAFASVDVQKRTAILPDTGHHSFSVTSRKTLGTALFDLLTKCSENKNTFHCICDGGAKLYHVVVASQAATGTQGQWNVSSFALEGNKRKADANLREGKMLLLGFLGVLGVPLTGGFTG